MRLLAPAAAIEEEWSLRMRSWICLLSKIDLIEQ